MVCWKTVRKIIICMKKDFDIRLALLCDIDVETVPKSTIFRHPFGIGARNMISSFKLLKALFIADTHKSGRIPIVTIIKGVIYA